MPGTLRKIGMVAANMLRREPSAVAGSWDRAEVFSKIPRGIGTIIDIGAHAGEFAAAAAKQFPDAIILGFEPLRACQKAWHANTAGIRHREYYACALGAENGVAVIHRNAFTPASSMLHGEPLLTRAFPYTFHSKDEKIRIRKLDDVLYGRHLPGKILLKIDVQGYEDRVLKGAMETLKSVDAVLIELTAKRLYKEQAMEGDVRTMLEHAGFRFAGHCGDIRHLLTGDTVQRDALFIRS